MIYPPFILPKHYLVALRLLFDLPCPIYYAIKTPQIHVRFYSVSCLVENEHNSLHILESYSTIPFFFLLKDQSTPLLEEKKNKVELDKTKSFILIPAYIEVLTRSWSLITWLYENHVTGKWCFFMWSKSIMV